MANRRHHTKNRRHTNSRIIDDSTTVRIVGGRLRRKKLIYDGDPRIRPMKERVREATFNLLGDVKPFFAVDLFAGTGALAFEAMSRGSERAILIERHAPTVSILRENARLLGIEEQTDIAFGDAFSWRGDQFAERQMPWIVFISPPYRFYQERRDDMIALIQRMIERSPEGSQIVVEADDSLDRSLLPAANQWDVRDYPPAVVAIWRNVPIMSS